MPSQHVFDGSLFSFTWPFLFIYGQTPIPTTIPLWYKRHSLSPKRLFVSYKSIPGCVFTRYTGCCSIPELGERVGTVAITPTQE